MPDHPVGSREFWAGRLPDHPGNTKILTDCLEKQNIDLMRMKIVYGHIRTLTQK